MDPDGPNSEQIAYWNEQAGPRWVEASDALDDMLGPLGQAALDGAQIAAGSRVLDVGCGAGQTTLEIGRRVGAEGSVLGVDISAPMLERARERARLAGLAQVSFEQADAQTEPLRDFDLVFSRFGVMFFADPVAAFGNLRRALAPGGRIVFLCWRAIADNPWMTEPLRAIAQHVELPPPQPAGPGPFSLADPERLRAILGRARFAELKIEPLDLPLTVGKNLDAALDFVLHIGPAGSVLREHPEAVTAASEAVRTVLAPYDGPDGVRMASASWLVSARA